MLKRFLGAITRLSLDPVLRWLTIGITVLSLIIGGQAAFSMNQELLPSLEFPQTIILTQWTGASSEDLRDIITLPLEADIVQINGVIKAGLESTTTAPISVIIVRNEYGLDQQKIRDQIKVAIDKVNANNVPIGLKTTADLTPELMRNIVSHAPSMFAHFKVEHLLAMSPEVLAAALEAKPDLLDSVDLITRDQLAAVSVNSSLTGTQPTREPVALPKAWSITTAQQPRMVTFSFNDVPVLTSSIYSTSPDVSSDELRAFVEESIVKPLKEGAVKDVAEVSVSGGQQIPVEIAAAAVAKAQEQAGTPEPTPSSTSTASASTPQQQPPTQPMAPKLPASWQGLTIGVLRLQIQTISPFQTADDLLTATDPQGKPRTAAEVLNAIAALGNFNNLLNDLTPEVLTYVRAKEPNFLQNLSVEALREISASVLTTGAWAQLTQPQNNTQAVITKLDDLVKIKGSAAATINEIVANLPTQYRSYGVRLIYDLTPESVAYLLHVEPTFLKELRPEIIQNFSAEVLQSLPTDFMNSLDATLKSKLQAIIQDPSQAPGYALQPPNEDFADDPNAPAIAPSWTAAMQTVGLTFVQADDLLKRPFGLKAGPFVNAIGDRDAKLIKDLSSDVLLYVQGKDPTFFSSLTASTLGKLSEETLAKLPADVQVRADTGGAAFVPTQNVTRANGRDSLIISVMKTREGNTVNVSDALEEFYHKIREERPDIQLNTVFGQAEFIKESISGVAREGGLGALMAVIVILLFLNFSVRSTLVTAVSIPASVAIAFVLMRYIPGPVHSWLQSATFLPEAWRLVLMRLFPESLTLNIMTLSGLTVAVGRVVDDSIVVLENIYRQLQASDVTVNRAEVIIRATRDVSLAIFAATLTTVVVFLPIGLTGGIVGAFFLPFGLAVTYSLAASFLVAITLVPLLALLFIRHDNIPEEKEGWLENAYHTTLEWTLAHRWLVLGLAAVTFVLGVFLLMTRPASFLPTFGEPQISIAVELPPGTKMATTDYRVREFEKYIQQLVTDGRLTRYQVQIGGGGIAAALMGGGGIQEGVSTITLAPSAKSTEEVTTLTQQIRTKAAEAFGENNVVVSKASLSEQGLGGFSVVISGPEEKLKAFAPRVKEALAKVPGLTNVASSLDQIGDIPAILRVNQTAAVSFTAELETSDTLGLTTKAIEAVKALPDVPTDVTIGQGFQSQQQTEGFAQTFSSMAIAIVIVYIVMVATFGSFIHPFTILFSLPLAIVGAALGLTLTNRVLGLSALIGMLMLIGIVVTNAIVMIDRVQANRKERGMPMPEALIEGARTRLRPILMTAIATIFALLPLAIGLSQGAIIAAELGTVVIGGLFSSTLLTLVVVPVIYSLIDRLSASLQRNRQV